jgi:hypothetical protein
MLSFRNAAPAAAVLFTLLSAAAYSDAGFAFGTKVDPALGADTIQIDADILEKSEIARSATPATPLSKVDDTTIFKPGTGDFVAPVPSAEPQVLEDRGEPLTAPNLAALVAKHGVPDHMDAEMRCLAGAVYFESKGESLSGQLAVARVVLARTQSGRFPSSICGVVFQKSQFSFVRGGQMPAIATGSQQWRNAVAIAQIALDGSWKSPVEGALFFHARYVAPGWKLKRIGSIDNHVFYR